jgi:hypothetical protein
LSLPGCEIPIPCFGSSDCHCPAHLFYFNCDPELQEFHYKLSSGVNPRSIACLPVMMVPNPHTLRL